MFFISDSTHHYAGGHCDISNLNCVSLDEGAFIKVPPLHPTGSISSAEMAKSEVSSEGSQGLAIVHHDSRFLHNKSVKHNHKFAAYQSLTNQNRPEQSRTDQNITDQHRTIKNKSEQVS